MSCRDRRSGWVGLTFRHCKPHYWPQALQRRPHPWLLSASFSSFWYWPLFFSFYFSNKTQITKPEKYCKETNPWWWAEVGRIRVAHDHGESPPVAKCRRLRRFQMCGFSAVRIAATLFPPSHYLFVCSGHRGSPYHTTNYGVTVASSIIIIIPTSIMSTQEITFNLHPYKFSIKLMIIIYKYKIRFYGAVETCWSQSGVDLISKNVLLMQSQFLFNFELTNPYLFSLTKTLLLIFILFIAFEQQKEGWRT